MKTTYIAHELDAALHSGKPEDKLAVLELANVYDRQVSERAMGMLVLEKLIDTYEEKPGVLPIRPIHFVQKTKYAGWLARGAQRPYAIVGDTLGTTYGHTITELKSNPDYATAAAKIRATQFGQRTIQDLLGPDPREMPPETGELATKGLQLGAYLHEIDYSIPGTTYFGDVVHAITTDTSK